MNAAHLAEQATLGALMLVPELPTQTAAWLRSEDFADPWHAAVHRVIHELAAAREQSDAHSVCLRLIDRLGYRDADAARIVDLLQAVPIRAGGRDYAALVIEGSIRRQVACVGVLLQAAALSAVTTGRPDVVDAVAAQIDAALIAAEHRWALATRATAPHSRTDSPATNLQMPEALPLHVAADRALSAHPLPSRTETADHESTLIAALAAHPGRIPEVADWLHPEAITSTTWRPVYAALTQLHANGRPIDEVTVAAEVNRCSRTRGPGPAVNDLCSAIADAAMVDVTVAARTVAGDHLRLTAARAACALRVDAANPGLDLRDLLDTTTLFTAGLRAFATHLAPLTRAPAPLPPSVSLPAVLSMAIDSDRVLSR